MRTEPNNKIKTRKTGAEKNKLVIKPHKARIMRA